MADGNPVRSVRSTPAERAADLRRAALGVFTGPNAHAFGMDLIGLPPHQVEAGHHEFAEVIVRENIRYLRVCDVWWADRDLCELIDAAAPGMPDQELRLDDPPVPNGFLVFAHPLPDRSGFPPEIPIAALSWFTLPAGQPLIADRIDQAAVLLTSWVFTDDLGVALGGERSPGSPALIPNASVVWAAESLIDTAFGERVDSPRGAPGFFQRVAAAFWTLVRQPSLTQTGDGPVSSPSDRRRHARAGIENPSKPVRVVSVRAPGGHESTGSGQSREVSWRGRWVVRGYWRRTWFPTLQDHRQQWIAPHLKGPADKPLLTGEKIYKVAGKPRTPGA